VTRTQGQTVVSTDDGKEANSYTLQDDVGQFENHLAKMQLDKAFDLLASSTDSILIEANWQSLIGKALDSRNFTLAEKAFDAIKDPRAKDVRDITARVHQLQKEHGRTLDDILEHYTVR
jgi:hypothetical protein